MALGILTSHLETTALVGFNPLGGSHSKDFLTSYSGASRTLGNYHLSMVGLRLRAEETPNTNHSHTQTLPTTKAEVAD